MNRGKLANRKLANLSFPIIEGRNGKPFGWSAGQRDETLFDCMAAAVASRILRVAGEIEPMRRVHCASLSAVRIAESRTFNQPPTLSDHFFRALAKAGAMGQCGLLRFVFRSFPTKAV
jgi:hypothetical protein